MCAGRSRKQAPKKHQPSLAKDVDLGKAHKKAKRASSKIKRPKGMKHIPESNLETWEAPGELGDAMGQLDDLPREPETSRAKAERSPLEDITQAVLAKDGEMANRHIPRQRDENRRGVDNDRASGVPVMDLTRLAFPPSATNGQHIRAAKAILKTRIKRKAQHQPIVDVHHGLIDLHRDNGLHPPPQNVERRPALQLDTFQTYHAQHLNFSNPVELAELELQPQFDNLVSLNNAYVLILENLYIKTV